MFRALWIGLLALPVSGQEVAVEETGTALAPGLAARIAGTSVGLREIDGGIWGHGPDFKVRFDGHGFEFTPALGSGAPRNFPLRFELGSVKRGEETLYEASSVAPQQVGTTVSYSRGAIEERYDVLPEGIAQSFLFAQPLAGEGDLVVTGRLITELETASGAATGRGLALDAVTDAGARLGGVSIGAVTGIDALGHRCAGRVSIVGDTLELSLPGEFVREAAYPLLLDPLISTQFEVSAGWDDTDPEVAYDASTGRFLVVWERTFSISNIEIRGQLVTTAGTLVEGLIPITSGTDVAFDPAVANVAVRNRFVVAWSEGPLFGPWDVRCATVDALTAITSLSALVATDARDASLSSEITDLDDDVVAVWRSFATPGIRVGQIQVTAAANATPQPLGSTALSNNSSDLRASISKSGGTTGVHLVVWDRQVGAERNIIRSIVSRNAAVLSAGNTLLNTATLGEERAKCDGDGRNFVVTYQQDESAGNSRHDVWVIPVTWTGSGSSTGTAHNVTNGPGDNERNPDVVFDGETYLIAWSDETPDGDYDTYAARLNPLNCDVCEMQFALAVGPDDFDFPALASQYTGSATSVGPFDFDQTLATWEALDADTSDGQILAQRMGSPGRYTDLGGGCGTAGRALAPCARTNYGSFNHMLTEAPGNQSAWLIMGFDTLGFDCGPCSLIANPFSGFVIATSTDNAGNAFVPMSIPNEPDLIGITFIDQWYVPSGNACTSLSGDLSNALEVTIQ